MAATTGVTAVTPGASARTSPSMSPAWASPAFRECDQAEDGGWRMEDNFHPLSSILHPLSFSRTSVNSLRAFVGVCCLLLTGACSLNYNSRSLGVPVTMAEPLAAGVAGDSFNVTTRAVHIFWGLSTVKEPSLHQVLAGQLGSGTGVRNVAIHARKRWSDVLVTALT